MSKHADMMIDLLRRVPDGAELVKNQVGNLSIVKDDEYIGFIDLRTFELDLFEDDE